jgi:hypothetical protein
MASRQGARAMYTRSVGKRSQTSEVGDEDARYTTRADVAAAFFSSNSYKASTARLVTTKIRKSLAVASQPETRKALHEPFLPFKPEDGR